MHTLDFPRSILVRNRLLYRALLLCCLATSVAIWPCWGQTWKSHPHDGDWTTKQNWTPASHAPNSSTADTIFGNSTITGISILNAQVDVRTMTFSTGAPAYTFNFSNGQFTVHGAVSNFSSNSPIFNIVSGLAFTSRMWRIWIQPR